MKLFILSLSVVGFVGCGKVPASSGELAAHPDKSIKISTLRYSFKNAAVVKHLISYSAGHFFKCQLFSSVGDATNKNEAYLELKFSTEPDEFDVYTNEQTNNLGFTKFADSQYGVFGATSLYSNNELRLFVRAYERGVAYLELVGRDSKDTVYEIDGDGTLTKVENLSEFIYGPPPISHSSARYYVIAYGKCFDG